MIKDVISMLWRRPSRIQGGLPGLIDSDRSLIAGAIARNTDEAFFS